MEVSLKHFSSNYCKGRMKYFPEEREALEAAGIPSSMELAKPFMDLKGLVNILKC